MPALPRTLRIAVLLCLIASPLTRATAQTPTPEPKTDAQLDAEASQAATLYQQSKALEALPLYQDLNAHRPNRPFYLERIGMGYAARSAAAGSEDEKRADLKLALDAIKAAQAAGDNSDLAQIMVEKLSAALQAPEQPKTPLAPGRDTFNQAEVLFSKGDLAGSVALYKKSYEENPQFYPAPLFAGDAEYKLNHFDEAGIWFARAIAIDPDTETAHRYWADSLMKANKPDEARKQYIEAFIASPYQKAPRLSLRAYATATHQRYIAPPITLPPGPTAGKDGHINITINMPTDGKSDPLSPVWLMYSMNSALWQGEKFKKEFPNEKQYRHSLAEEVDSIKMLLAGVREQKIKDSDLTPTLRNLSLSKRTT